MFSNKKQGKKTVLVVFPAFPLPVDRGAFMRLHGEIRQLRKHAKVVLLANGGRATEGQVRELESLVDELCLVHQDNKKSIFHRIWYRITFLLLSRITGMTTEYFYNSIIPWSDEIRRLRSRHDFQSTLIHFWYWTDKVLRTLPSPVWMDTHDLQREKAEYLLNLNKIRRKSFAWLKKNELHKLSLANGLIAITPHDLNVFQQSQPENMDFIEVPTSIEAPPGDGRKPERFEPVVGYFGALSAVSNLDSIRWFVQEVWPLIRKRHPQAVFRLFGSNPPPLLKRMADKDESIELYGFVDDMYKAFREVSVMVCPMMASFGFRTRLIEIAASRTPMVVNENAIHGMGLPAHPALAICDDPNDFAVQVVHWLQRPDEGFEQANNYWGLIKDKYTVDNGYKELVEKLTSDFSQSSVRG